MILVTALERTGVGRETRPTITDELKVTIPPSTTLRLNPATLIRIIRLPSVAGDDCKRARLAMIC